MATQTVYADTNVDGIATGVLPWGNGDTLVINNRAVVTVNTDQASCHRIYLQSGGYVGCVAGDIGKVVTDDAASIGRLISYDNTNRVWVVYGSGPWEVVTGSVMAITTGTGAGTSTGSSQPGEPRYWTQVTINNGTLKVSMPGPTLNFVAGGYTPCIAGDIGKTVVGAGSGHTGVLVSYDNTLMKWSIDSMQPFQNGEAISITGGTGAGTLANPNGRTLGIRFYTGRYSGNTAASPVYPQSGLGKFEISGNFVELGTGTGGADTFTSPFGITSGLGYDYIPALWVETGNGTGVFEIWLNAGYAYGQAWPHLRNGIDACFNDGSYRGKFFRQTSNAEPYTESACPGTHFTNSLLFGEAGGGTPVPNGARVRCPNILLTNGTSCYYYTATGGSTVGAHRSLPVYDANLSLGGIMTASCCLFDEFFINGTQAQTLTLTNCGFAIAPLISECYGLTITNVGITVDKMARYRVTGTGTVWTSRDYRFWTVTWNFISGASISNLVVASHGSTTTANSLSAILVIQYSADVTASNIIINAISKLNRGTVISYGHNCFYGNYLTDCTFTTMKCYGGGYIFLSCTSLTVNGFKYSETMFHSSSGQSYTVALGAATNTRIGINPNTGVGLVVNTPYYFKVRAYHNVWDTADYFDNPITYSATPYIGRTDAALGNDWYPFYFGVALYIQPAHQISLGAGGYVSCVIGDIGKRVTDDGRAVGNLVSYDNTNRIWYISGPGPWEIANASVMAITGGTGAGTASAASIVAQDSQNGAYWTVYTRWNDINASPISAPFVKYQLYKSTVWGVLGTQVGVDPSAATIRMTAAATVAWPDYPGLVIQFNAGGYVNAVAADVGRTVVGGTSTSIGILREYNNTLRQWYVEATPTNVYQDAEAVTITGGTGAGTISGGGRALNPLTNGTTYYYTLRRFYDNTNYVDSAQQVAIIPNFDPWYPNINITNNICLQSSTLATTWTPTNCTATNAIKLSPLETLIGTATGSRLVFSAANGSVVQNVATTLVPQSFSVYLCADEPSGVAVDIGIGGGLGVGTTTHCALTQKWQRFSVLNVTPGATPVSVGIYADATSNGKTIYACLAQLERDVTTHNPVTTTTVPVLAAGFPQMISSTPGAGIAVWSKGGYNQIEISLNLLPVGTIWAEVFMDTNPAFTPSKANLITTTLLQSTGIAYLSTATDNVILANLTKEGYGCLAPNQPLLYATAFVTNSKFFNWTWDCGFNTYRLIDISSATECANLLFHNWRVNKIKNYAGTLFNTVNAHKAIVVQNFVTDTTDVMLSDQWLNCDVKGVPGAWTGCLYAQRTHTLVMQAGGYVDCVAADITRVVNDDGVAVGTLIGFDNTTREWLVIGAGPWEVANGSVITITSGTGAGTTTGVSTVSGIRSNILPWNATAVDCITPAYVTVYDTLFHELYLGSTTKGALSILFNASQKVSPPYAITGGAKFLNTGGLAFSAANDSIVYTWPWKIYGISSFQNLDPVTSSTYLGNATWTAFGIYKEYSISTDGVVWPVYKEMTGANLSGEVVSASAGFYLKIRLTAKKHFQYNARITNFVLSETIANADTAGSLDSATAVVDKIEVTPPTSTTGTLWVTTTGDWNCHNLVCKAPYVNCVPGDIGLPVTDDGVTVGILTAYDNAALTWRIAGSGPWEVAINSVMAITGGTGSGVANAASTIVTEIWSGSTRRATQIGDVTLPVPGGPTFPYIMTSTIASLLSGLMIFTNVDQSELYPTTYVDLVLKGVVANSTYWVYNTDTSEVLATGTAAGGDITLSVPYDYFAAVNILVRVRKATATAYKPFETAGSYNALGGTVYVSQELDMIVTGPATTAYTFDTVNNILIVDSPTTEVTIQDIYNAIAYFLEANMNIDTISDATGKQVLGSGVYVGITLTLLDWLLQFEDRPGPAWSSCKVSGGNLVAVDAMGVTLDTPIEPGDYVNAAYQSSTSAALLSTAASDPWSTMLPGAYPDGSAGATLAAVFDSLDNPYKVDPATSELLLYNRVGGGPIKRWPLKDKNGNDIVLTGTGATERQLRTL